MPGTLYVVATPIGNLQDITLRALEVLQKVDCIACEDTRVTSRLLQRYRIEKPLISYHEYNEQQRAEQLVKRLLAGQSIALVSDAGTPSLSDPGAYLVSAAAANGIRCVPIPGPSALAAILAVGGQVAEPVVFFGFLPSRAAQRQKFLRQIQVRGSYCFYEAPHRILSLLRQLATEWDNPAVVVGRELTKLHEEVLRGSAREVAAVLEARNRIRGEFVVLVEKKAWETGETARSALSTESLEQEFDRLLAAGHDRKSALRLLARSYGLSRREIYRKLVNREGKR